LQQKSPESQSRQIHLLDVQNSNLTYRRAPMASVVSNK